MRLLPAPARAGACCHGRAAACCRSLPTPLQQRTACLCFSWWYTSLRRCLFRMWLVRCPMLASTSGASSPPFDSPRCLRAGRSSSPSSARRFAIGLRCLRRRAHVCHVMSREQVKSPLHTHLRRSLDSPRVMKAGKLANAFAALEPEDGAAREKRKPSRSRRTSSPATPADAATQAPGGANGADASAATLGGPQHGEPAGEPGAQDPDGGDWQPMVPRHSRHRSSSTGGSTGNLLSQLSAGSEALVAAADSVKAESEGQQQRVGNAPAASPPPAAPTSPVPRQQGAEHTASLEACQAATRQVRPDSGGANRGSEPPLGGLLFAPARGPLRSGSSACPTRTCLTHLVTLGLCLHARLLSGAGGLGCSAASGRCCRASVAERDAGGGRGTGPAECSPGRGGAGWGAHTAGPRRKQGGQSHWECGK